MGRIKRKTYKKKYSKRTKYSNRTKNFKGGMASFVGAPLNYNNFSTYPGVTTHSGNHYGLNPLKIDLTTGDITSERDFSIFPNKYFRGGYVYNTPTTRIKKTRSKTSMRGGLGPLLSDVVNGTQNIGNSVGNIYNTLVGNPTDPSPLPYEQKLVSSYNI